ncbi:MAG: tRNA lysidine(34) synthetase TilS, partial [Clostridia bacterium]|nr:tRNA lysidine(34) synthetase TilS [Clostridia bacterium]
MMRERFRQGMERFALPEGSTLTVALSGGLDSVVLLHLLKELPDRAVTLEAAHVNHGLRGEAARRDQEFCQALCAEWEIPFRCFEGDAKTYAEERGMSPEEGARALRYGFLDELADGKMCFCATAHHRQDQLETFFINLYRGSGSNGLSGIKSRRGGYIRPLLEMEKEQLCAYAAEHHLSYVTDETNADTAYLRNFLRHEILPLLESREEGRFSEGLAASMRILAAEEEALSLWAGQVDSDEAEVLGKLPDAILKRVLDRMNGAPLSRLHFGEISALIRSAPPAGQVQIARERYFRLEYGRCVFLSPEEEPMISVTPDRPIRWGDWEFHLRLEEINSAFTHFQIDCDKIVGNPVFRHKRPGDRFLPAGKSGT